MEDHRAERSLEGARCERKPRAVGGQNTRARLRPPKGGERPHVEVDTDRSGSQAARESARRASHVEPLGGRKPQDRLTKPARHEIPPRDALDEVVDPRSRDEARRDPLEPRLFHRRTISRTCRSAGPPRLRGEYSASIHSRILRP